MEPLTASFFKVTGEADIYHSLNCYETAGVQQSFSASGRPCDNSFAETFFATFKKEEAYRRTYSSEQDYRKSVERYIEFYNEKRPHRSLAYKTPAHFEELFGKK